MFFVFSSSVFVGVSSELAKTKHKYGQLMQNITDKRFSDSLLYRAFHETFFICDLLGGEVVRASPPQKRGPWFNPKSGHTNYLKLVVITSLLKLALSLVDVAL